MTRVFSELTFKVGTGLSLLLVSLQLAPAHPAAVEAWVRRYNSELASSSESARKIVTDLHGNIIVAGSLNDAISAGTDMLILKYSPVGAPLWTNRYDGPVSSDDRIDALAVDTNGNVFVAGFSIGVAGFADYVTLAYSSAGVPLWTNRYHGQAVNWDIPLSMAVDSSGRVVVGGSAGTVAYSATGLTLWTNDTFARAIAIDSSGNVFGTGYWTFGLSPSGIVLWETTVIGTAIALDQSGNVFLISPATYGDYPASTIAMSAAGVPLWTNRHEGTATALAVDLSGNVYVTGFEYGGANSSDYATVAYTGAGVPLWTNRYDGPANGNDEASAIAVDYNGNVFVTGRSLGTVNFEPEIYSDYDYATIAYSGAGVPLWTNRYDGGNHLDSAAAVAVDKVGRVFVTGKSQSQRIEYDDDFATLAYSGAGEPLWTQRHDSVGNGSDRASAIAVDQNNGNVFVTGSATGSNGASDYVTLAYSAAGVPLWTNRYDGGHNDYPRDLAVDRNGRVLVTGSSQDTNYFSQYVTIAYSGDGVPLWTNRHEGTATALAVDLSGNAYVTGINSNDYATIAYSAAGMALWTNRYDGPGNRDDHPYDVAVDTDGNVFVTGESYGNGPDYATIAYSAAGMPLWTNRYDGTYGWASARAVAVDNNGRVFVAGTSQSRGGLGFTSLGYTTIAYSTAGLALWTNHYSPLGVGSHNAWAMAVDKNGNVFVTGSVFLTEQNLDDYATVAYSSTGISLWTNLYNGPVEHCQHCPDTPYAIGVDTLGNVIVTGDSLSDYVTIAYSAAGVPLWTNRYDGPARGYDYAPDNCLAVGPAGVVYVTGHSDGGYGGEGGYFGIPDYATVKYTPSVYVMIEPRIASSSPASLKLSGYPGSNWSIERAPTITGPWTRLGDSLIAQDGQGFFDDNNLLPNGAFYRATQP